ncbi:MAG: ankyrin repeat domain-containing protein, partial [Bacteroidota bacterium]|nr:ankyrin repeat domain-containing protein [Bacteroidota bacterium]
VLLLVVVCWIFSFNGSAQQSVATNSNATRELFHTIRSGNATRLDSLLKAGADPNASLDGYSALMSAALNGSKEEMELLIRHGADVHYRNSDSITALWLAVSDEEKARLLLAHGAKADVRSREGNTVLVKLAAIPGSAGLMQLLIEKGCNPRNSGPANDVMYNAALSGDTAILGLLIRQGLSINDTASIGDYPINAATIYRTFNTLKMLVDHGADVNVSPRNAPLPLMIGITPLMWTAINNDKPSFYYLLQHGANANAKSIREYTPLMFLAMADADDPEMTLALIKHGADPSAKAPDVTDALFYARLKGATKSVEILTNYSNKKQ